MATAVKTKKKSKVDPLLEENDTELDDLGPPPSTADLSELFEADLENADTNAGSSVVALTEETGLEDSRSNSKNSNPQDSSRASTPSRSSTPSGLKRLKRNTVTPIHEETSFGAENKSYEPDENVRPPSVQAWSESSGSLSEIRPSTAPSNDPQMQKISTPSRPDTAPMSPRSKLRNNKVTPLSSRSTTPVEKFKTPTDGKTSLVKPDVNETIPETPVENEPKSLPVDSKPKSECRPSTKQSYKRPLTKESTRSPDIVKADDNIENTADKTDLTEKSIANLDESHISVQSAEAVLAPPESSGDHAAYIPIEHAKVYIQKVIEDMKKMKANHYEVVEKIQQQYQLIEEESQAQFNDYVIKLRGEYNTKVLAFKHLIDSHQTEFTNKQKFYEEAIRSLREKNRQLLLQKKDILVKAKETNGKHEEEKHTLLTDLTGMLDQKHKEYIVLHSKYSEEKVFRQDLQKEVVTHKEEINTLKSQLSICSSDGQKVSEDLMNLRKENEELTAKLQNTETEKSVISDEKGKLDEQHNEKITIIDEKTKEIDDKSKEIDDKTKVIDDKTKEIETKNEEMDNKNRELETKTQELETKTQELKAKTKEIEELLLKIKELEERAPVVVAAPPASVENETVVEQTTEVVPKDSVSSVSQESLVQASAPANTEETSALKAKIKTLEDQLEKLKTTRGEENDNYEAEMKTLRDEKNIAKMELINAEEKNQILHRRLETMLNEVVDTVNVDHIAEKVGQLNKQKTALDDEINDIKKKIDEWKETYRQENNGQEPSEDDRPDNITDLFDKLKEKSENLSAVTKDLTVLNMLLDGTLPDDMKQEGNAPPPSNSALDELREQHKIEEERLNKIINDLKEQVNGLQDEKRDLKIKIEELEGREPLVETVVSDVVVTPKESEEGNEDLSSSITELTTALHETQSQLDEKDKEHSEELDALKKQNHKLEKKLAKQEATIEKLQTDIRELESQLKVQKEATEAELTLKQQALDDAKKEIDKLNEEKIAKLPVKAKAEIKSLQQKLKAAEASKDGNNQEVLDLKTQIASLTAEIENQKISLKTAQEKEVELQKLKEIEKKYKELKKKYKALEAKKVVTKTITTPGVVAAAAAGGGGGGADPEEVKALKKKEKGTSQDVYVKNQISNLEKQVMDGGDPTPTTPGKKDGKVDPKAMMKLEKSNEMFKEKNEAMKKAAQDDANKIKDLQEKLKEAKSSGNDKNSKKKEKEMKDLQKKFESEQKKTAKLKEDVDKTKEELANNKKDLDSSQSDLKKSKDEIAKLGVAAQEGLEAMEKVSELSKSNKELNEENKTLAENFNSERILRKKYYNMVEDMKGKIRVYCRARPLSRSELDRGNHSIISSPDEYSLIVQTARGVKDFQYDAVFTPDHNQEKVFEDTNNLIQSAVDGYNVCIFAYGQTGSGKTFTMIGDKEQKFPGIAPRAFKAIYDLIDENKKKFDFTTSIYMMELYRDNLIDLFGDSKNPAKLDIKKDKKGMVVVTGSVVRHAANAEELMAHFEKGSESRHVASTKMNAESSRSHLVLSIVIESTNKTSGAVVKGKLSLVDLAGSERANKTGATAEQLKEAQSINKSLSALGDVISALSSEQSFIPYRNNKLTLLMQDSLGGNAKTLMFVNISPADYNADETITSLTYASRVKLITNDASKNSDNKEIARLKGIISKLKKGESVDDDE